MATPSSLPSNPIHFSVLYQRKLNTSQLFGQKALKVQTPFLLNQTMFFSPKGIISQ